MKKITLLCPWCDDKYTVVYDETETNEKPTFCPFCGDEINLVDDIYEEDSENLDDLEDDEE